MSYKEKSIYDVVKEIDAGKFYLPALQRKFVWDEDRITLLFDSILRGYPISTFLFWFLKKEKANEYVFYKFLDRFDERDPFNKRKDGNFTKDEIIGVLDGQQRLSSIYIGLQGKYISKIKHKRRNNPDAWPERELYINLLETPYTVDSSDEYPQVIIDETKNFDLKFLKRSHANRKEIEKKGNKKLEYWFKLGELIKWNADTSPSDVFEHLLSKEKNEQIKGKLQFERRFIEKTVILLRDKFIKDPIINYFETSKEDLEAILNIFVRVNSGAMVLSKSDLLFSTIIATWENGREEIENLQKDLNKKGDGFSFNNDFIMRCLLVLSDLPVIFKVNSFKTNNVKLIKENWPDIRKALLTTMDILTEAGLSKELIPSQNAVIPIAYYVYKGGDLSVNAKNELIKYLKHAFLKNVYGNQADAVIQSMRNAIRQKTTENGKTKYVLKNNSFSFRDFVSNLKLSGDKSMLITNDDMEEFLETKKSQYTFILLSMIYPGLKYGQFMIHQDHIHPYSMFRNHIFDELNLSDEERQDWKDKRNMLPNLQLMEGRENQSKNDKPFKDWINQSFGNNKDAEKAKLAYLERNYIDADIPLDFCDFIDFFETRKEKLRLELSKVLELKHERSAGYNLNQ